MVIKTLHKPSPVNANLDQPRSGGCGPFSTVEGNVPGTAGGFPKSWKAPMSEMESFSTEPASFA
jgi:hypothetical protein